MNSVSVFSNILRKVISPGLMAPTNIALQQTRNTFVLRRKHPLNLLRKGTTPKAFKKRNYIYELVKNTDASWRPPLKLILTQYVDGVGDQGELITCSAMRAYNNFLLPGLAVYATPENMAKYDVKERDESNANKTSNFITRTKSVLSTYLLNIVMSAENPWTLEKWHVRVAFRKAAIILNEDCITMPPKPITGPNFDFENKEFYVTVTINKTCDVKVRCRIHHWSNDPRNVVPSVSMFYLKPSEPIFPEDKPDLDALPLPYLMQKAMENKNATTQ